MFLQTSFNQTNSISVQNFSKILTEFWNRNIFQNLHVKIFLIETFQKQIIASFSSISEITDKMLLFTMHGIIPCTDTSLSINNVLHICNKLQFLLWLLLKQLEYLTACNDWNWTFKHPVEITINICSISVMNAEHSLI